MSSLSIKFLIKEVNDIYYYHTNPKKYMIITKFSFPKPLFFPKLVRSNLSSFKISENENKFFGYNQIINFYRKYKLLRITLYKIIENISNKWLKELNSELFHFLMTDYLFPSYNTFYTYYPNTLFKSFHNSYLNPKKLTIIIIKTLILNYDDILKLCPSLYILILNIIIKLISLFKKIDKLILTISIIDFISMSIKNFPILNLEEIKKYKNIKQLKKIIYNVLDIFIND